MSARARLWAWLLLPVVVLGALVVGARGDEPETVSTRVQRLADQVRCPTCKGQSVADSDAPAARAVHADIRARVDDGDSDADIRAALVAAYGEEILLNPPRSGWAGLVWVLPVAGLVVATAGLVVAFRRWRPSGVGGATDDDLAAAARARQDMSELPR